MGNSANNIPAKSRLKWHLSDVFWVGIWIIALIVALNVVLYFLKADSFIKGSNNKSIITMGLFMLQEMIFIVPVYFLVMRRRGVRLADLGMQNCGAWKSIAWALKGLGIMIAFNVIFMYLLERFGPLPGFGRQASHVPLFGEAPLDLTIGFIVLVVIAPFIEELLFRGLILQTLLSRFRPWTASLLTAVLFGMVHLEFQSLGIIIFLSLVLNWMYMRTKSIYPSVLFHMINNTLAFTVEILVTNGTLAM